MQRTVDPAVLTSSPIRQLYEVLSIFESNRDWSTNARAELLERVAARVPATHQPDAFMLNSMLEELGVGHVPDLEINENETIPGISLLSRGITSQAPTSSKKSATLSPQLAKVMTTREMAALAMLQLFTELSEQRIASWGRVAKLIVTQPMDGFDVVKPEWTTK